MNGLLARLERWLPRGSFGRNVAVLAGGTAVGQAIVVLASPVLTRLYTPEDFGVLAVYSSLLGIFSTVAALRYELAIPLPEKDEDAAALVVLCLMIVPGMSVLVGLGVWLLTDSIAVWTNVQALGAYFWMLPVGMALVGTYQVLNYWTTRRRRFAIVSRTRLVQSVIQVGVQLVSGAVGVAPVGLIIGHIAGQSAGIGWLLRHSGISLLSFSTSTKKLLALASQHRKFPVFNTWGALLNVVGTQAAPLLLASFFGPGISGLFLLTMRVLTLPASLIGNAVAQVFYPTVASQVQEPEVTRSLIMRTFKALFVVAFPVFLTVAFFGADLFAFIFGSEWAEAGLYAQYLSPWLLLAFISSPLSAFALARGRQKTAMWITVYETALRLSVLLVAGFVNSPLLAMVLYSSVGTVISGVYISWIFHLAGASMRTCLGSLRDYGLTGALLLLALSVLKVSAGAPPWLILIPIAIGCLCMWSLKILCLKSKES